MRKSPGGSSSQFKARDGPAGSEATNLSWPCRTAPRERLSKSWRWIDCRVLSTLRNRPVKNPDRSVDRPRKRPELGITSRELVGHEDLAIYRSKDPGRNNYRFYEASLGEIGENRRSLEVVLREPLIREELGPEYQPIFELRERQRRRLRCPASIDAPPRASSSHRKSSCT